MSTPWATMWMGSMVMLVYSSIIELQIYNFTDGRETLSSVGNSALANGVETVTGLTRCGSP